MKCKAQLISDCFCLHVRTIKDIWNFPRSGSTYCLKFLKNFLLVFEQIFSEKDMLWDQLKFRKKNQFTHVLNFLFKWWYHTFHTKRSFIIDHKSIFSNITFPRLPEYIVSTVALVHSIPSLLVWTETKSTKKRKSD